MPYDKTNITIRVSSHSSRMWNILCFELHIIGSEISCIYTDVEIASMYGNGGQPNMLGRTTQQQQSLHPTLD